MALKISNAIAIGRMEQEDSVDFSNRTFDAPPCTRRNDIDGDNIEPGIFTNGI